MKFFQTGQGRVFLQLRGAGPGNSVSYQGCGRLGGLTAPKGDVSPVYCPDPDSYDTFKIIGEVRGEEGLPTTSLIAKFSEDNPLLRIRCPFDVQAHYGQCADPTDFDGGWEKIIAFERARLTNVSSDDLTAIGPDERAEILITGEITARAVWEIDRLVLSERAESLVTREVVDVKICDNVSCGDCGDQSDGCEKIYAIAKGSGLASPGLPAELLYSLDKGQTWSETDIDTLASDEDPDGLACVGNYLVVVSADSNSLHYANKSDLDTWAEVTTGFEASGQPQGIWSAGARYTWIVGKNGYVYFTDDPTAGVEVQDAGVATSEDLNAVHGLDELFVVAVGDNNAVIFTDNGGDTWAAITGPSAGNNLTCVWVRSQYCWLVGDDAGSLWYTEDQGQTWTEKAFSGSGSGVVRAIAFSDNDSPFGFLAHSTATPAGRILRTLNGGYSWHLLPEGSLSIPANDYIGALAACRHDPNFVVGVGLADDGADGIILVGA